MIEDLFKYQVMGGQELEEFSTTVRTYIEGLFQQPFSLNSHRNRASCLGNL